MRQYVIQLTVGLNLLLCSPLSLVLFSAAEAQWSTDPEVNTIVNADPGGQALQLAVTDGQGGVITAWIESYEENGIEHEYDVAIQRVDRYGYITWNPDGVTLCDAPQRAYLEGMVPDSLGGAIVLWRDYRGYSREPIDDYASNSLYIERVDSTGQPRWGATTNGLCLRSLATAQHDYDATMEETLVPDGQGGAYIAWREMFADTARTYSPTIFLQHVDATGQILYEENGRIVQYQARRPVLVPAPNYGVYQIGSQQAMRYAAEGTPVWAERTFVDTAYATPRAIPDGAGGFIWAAKRNDEYIGMQRVDSTGRKLWEPIKLTIEGDPTTWMRLVPDLNSGAIVGWYTNIPQSQHIDSAGIAQWDSLQHPTVTTSDGKGGYFSLWHDIPGEPWDTTTAYIQRITGDGTALWSEPAMVWRRDRVPGLCGGGTHVVPDGQGGLIAVFDYPNSGTGCDILAQQVSRNGNLGEVITAVHQETTPPTLPILSDLALSPNPTNDSIQLQFTLHTRSTVTIRLFDLLGRQVMPPIRLKESPGEHIRTILLRTGTGHALASGMYLCRVKADKQVQVRKFSIVK